MISSASSPAPKESSTRSSDHLSMLRSYTAADALTIGNASCGSVSIFLCLDYLATGSSRYLWIAFALLPLALVCDVLDGIVARTQKGRQSVLGGDLDSLADVISFGVAPAVLGFTLGLRGGWDMLGLTYFIVCGVRSEEHTSELQSLRHLVCRLL